MVSLLLNIFDDVIVFDLKTCNPEYISSYPNEGLGPRSSSPSRALSATLRSVRKDAKTSEVWALEPFSGFEVTVEVVGTLLGIFALGGLQVCPTGTGASRTVGSGLSAEVIAVVGRAASEKNLRDAGVFDNLVAGPSASLELDCAGSGDRGRNGASPSSRPPSRIPKQPLRDRRLSPDFALMKAIANASSSPWFPS